MASPEHDIQIQHIDPARLDDLVDAQNRIFVDYLVPIRSSRTFFLDFLKSVGGQLANVLVALDQDRIVGYATPVFDVREGWIGGIGILPVYRGKGIGTRLMVEAEKFLRGKGVSWVYLEVIEGNHRAQRLYERLGYRATRKLVCAEGRPVRFEGFGEAPVRSTLEDILPIHASSYSQECWQRRKVDAVAQSSKGAEIYRLDGGFVMLRAVDSNGFMPFLGVSPDQRRKGVGTSLAKFALNRLYELGTFKASVFNVSETEANMRMLDMFDFRVTMKQTEMRKGLES